MDVQSQRLLRFEDRLHFAFILHHMRNDYRYVRALGEVRYYGLKDNTMSETYQAKRQSCANEQYVQSVITATFNRTPR
jgi:hypothetical protein